VRSDGMSIIKMRRIAMENWLIFNLHKRTRNEDKEKVKKSKF
jgi:hypothetical protein